MYSLQDIRRFSATPHIVFDLDVGISEEIDISSAKLLFPVIACWPLDNQGAAAHLCLAISCRSRHKCRKCLIQDPGIRTPGLIGPKRDFEEANTLACNAEAALVKQWKGDNPLTLEDQQHLKRCQYLNIQKTPLLYVDKQHCLLSKDPYSTCPYDDLHTLSEGLLKGWAIWTVVCIASVAELDPTNYELGLHRLDSKLMGFPSVMIPEILRRHRFPQVSKVV